MIHPDVPDDVAVEVSALEAAPADDVEPVQAQSEASSETLVASDDVTTDVVAEAQESPAVTEPAEPELPAVVGGIPPEEVAQREAEQFAKGLAQAQEEAAAQLAEAVEKAMAEGLAKGLEQGKAEGLAEGLQQGIEQGLAQGKAQGLAEGDKAAREAMAEEMAAQRVLFENVSTELGALIEEPKKFLNHSNASLCTLQSKWWWVSCKHPAQPLSVWCNAAWMS